MKSWSSACRGACGHPVSMRGSTLSHAPTDANPKNSKHARVMNPAVSRTMPVASSTTHTTEAVRKSRPNPGMPRLQATIDSNESPSPAAAKSWRIGLTGMGMRPTMVKCSPAEMTEARKPRAVRRPMLVGSAVTERTP